MALSSDRRRHLLLAHLSLQHLNPPEFVSIAATAGFDGVSLRLSRHHADSSGPAYSMACEDSSAMRDTLAILADSPISVHEVGAFRLGPQTKVADFEPMLVAGRRLGARYAMTVCDDEDTGRCCERFAELAMLAAAYGMAPVLEFMVYSGVKTLAAANAIVGACGQPNAYVMVDALHWARSGGRAADIASVPAERMPYVQLCDAPAKAPDDAPGLMFEARKHRLFPGEGGLPLRDFLGAFSPEVAVSLEVPHTMGRTATSDLELARWARLCTLRLFDGSSTS